MPDTLVAVADAPQSPTLAGTGSDLCLYLLGRPTLKQVIRFVRRHGAGHHPTDGIITAWDRAAKLIATLQTTEGGRADRPTLERLGSEYKEVLTTFLKDPLIIHGFNTLPTEVVLVPLDQLVVWQRHIDLTHVERLCHTLSPGMGREELFRVCLPPEHRRPPVEWCRTGDRKFVFRSPSNDLRFLGTMDLEEENLREYPPPGAIVGVVGLAVGFGSNFLNAIMCEGRLLLNNGSHRAYALRKLGYTHVPCIVQHASSRAELELVASSMVRKDPDPYLVAPRPSMLPDYFHPELQLTLPIHRRARQITIRFEIEEEYAPIP